MQTSFTHTYLVREHRQNSDEISVLLRSFWEVEASGTLKDGQILNFDDKLALEKVEMSIKYVDGRYHVAIPWKDDEPELPDNYEMLMRRLFNTENRLRNIPEVGETYSKCISRYLEKRYIRKIDPAESGPSKKWYLPHFPVVRPGRTTTKTRIVFDASAKCERVSLNDTFLPGPKLQKDLNDLLLRFRKHPVALVCDNAEMYLRIEVASKDRPYLRFLWRSLEKEEPEEFEFNRVVFGVNASPFQAQFVAQANAEKHKDEFPMAAETVLKSTYMDDSMDSVVDDNQALELYSQLDKLWSRVRVRARKWLSNSSKLLEKIPVEDRAYELHLGNSGVPMVKRLEVTWLPEKDVLTFKTNPPVEGLELTKRSFLKKISKLFDPVGFLAAFLIRAKILLQEMWAAGLDWYDLFQGDLARRARTWFSELDLVS